MPHFISPRKPHIKNTQNSTSKQAHERSLSFNSLMNMSGIAMAKPEQIAHIGAARSPSRFLC